MDLINRYLYAVTSRLPEDIREDVKRELQANIEDMLPASPQEADIRQVLEKLGNPAKLANEYRQVKRYLIGPGLYDNYISVLKLVTWIACIVFASIALLDGVLKAPADSNFLTISIAVFVDVLIAVIQGIYQTVFWVTLTFAILERTGVNEGKNPFGKKEWTTEDLPPLYETKKGSISRGETIFSIACTVFFIAILYFRPELIGIYGKGENGLRLTASLLVTDRLHKYIFIILVLAIVQFTILIYKFILSHWTLPLAIANAAHNAALCILAFVMITDKSLINQDFISTIANVLKVSASQVSEYFSKGILISAVIFIAICLWESIMGFIKCKK